METMLFQEQTFARKCPSPIQEDGTYNVNVIFIVFLGWSH